MSHHSPSSSTSGHRSESRVPHAATEAWQAVPAEARNSQVDLRDAHAAMADPMIAAAPDATPRKSSSKITPYLKQEICQLVAEGFSLNAAAKCMGVSRAAVYRERLRDPEFKTRLSQQQETIARKCINTMQSAAKEKWQAAERLYKLVYPDRYFRRPQMISEKKHNIALAELVKAFSAVATPAQLKQLDHMFNPPPK